MEKNGMLTEDSVSDYNNTKKAEFYDREGFSVADRDNVSKLKDPAPIKELLPEEKE